MKLKEKQKLQQSSPAELKKSLDELTVDLIRIKQEKQLGKLTDLKQPIKLRKQIALIRTLLTQKEELAISPEK